MSSSRKVAYLLDWKFEPDSGVGKKVIDQIHAWRKFGLDVNLYLSTRVENSVSWENRLEYEKLPFVKKTYSGIFGRFIARKKLSHELRNENFDILYTRFGVLQLSFLRIMKRIPTVFELNTITLNEYKQRSLFIYLYFLLFEKQFLKKAIGVCAVTYEIADDFKNKIPDVPCIVFPNSINLESIPELKNSTNLTPKLCFVGSAGQEWHGISRLLDLAKTFPSYEFFVVGPEKNTKLDLPNNVKFVGPLYNLELYSLLEKMDIAISSLALDLNGMKEASPLKTRLYLGLGLPIIMGYNDTAFLDDEEFIFKIKPWEWPLGNSNYQKLNRFILNWRGKRVPRQAISKIEANSIEKQRVLFLNSVSRSKL